MTEAPNPAPSPQRPLIDDEGEIDLVAVVRTLLARWKLLTFVPLAAGVISLLVTTYMVKPTFTASTVLMPPAQSSSSNLAALAGQLGGALGGLAGAAAGIKDPAQQYVALLQSRNVSDRIIERFQLMDLYEAEFREDARKVLSKNVRISAGKKDGLLSVEVDDHSPERAAEMANVYVDELQRITKEFAVGEASQRRAFFEGQVKEARAALTAAEKALGSSGITEEALKAAPEAAVVALAEVKAKVAAQQVKIAAMRGFVSDDNPDLRQAQTELAALQAEMRRVQATAEPSDRDSGYAEKYRDFKYNQRLFELLAQQYELARLDEAREGMMIQVIDAAVVPERKSKPKRGLIAGLVTLASGMLLASLALWQGRNAGSVV